MKRRTAALGVVLVALAGCARANEPAAPDRDADLAAIAQARASVLEALRSDDVAGILAAVTPDHLTMPPNEAAIPGGPPLAAWHQRRIDQFVFASTFHTEDIRLDGDLAVERWSMDTKLTPRAGGTDVTDRGKGLWVWQRQPDGSWKLLYSIWNSDNSVPAS